MADPIADHLQRDLRGIDLLDHFYGLNQRDIDILRLLHRTDGGLTVDAIADQLDCERTTAYRAVARLLDADLVTQEQVNYEHGGYYHLYQPRPPQRIAENLQRTLNDWYVQVSRVIQEFEETSPPSWEGEAATVSHSQ